MIRCHYGEAELEQIKALYQELKTIPCKGSHNETLFVTAVLPGEEEEEDTVLDAFDECDKKLYFDVSVEVKGEDILYSIASASYRSYLEFIVSPKTLKQMSYASILAHSLWS